MNISTFAAEQALRMFEVDNRRTEVGRAVSKALADVNPRLADIAIHGGTLLPGETRKSLIADVVRVLRPLTWARSEMVVAAVMRPFGHFDNEHKEWLMDVPRDEPSVAAARGKAAKLWAEYNRLGLGHPERDGARLRHASAEDTHRKLRWGLSQERWYVLLDEVQAAWDASVPEVRP